MTTTAPQRWAIFASVLVGLIGLQWWATPETYPFGPGDDSGDMSFLTRLESGSAAAIAGLLGAAGVLTGWLLGRRTHGIGRRMALGCAVLQAVVLGYVVPDITALMFIAYLLAMIGPVAALGFVVYRSARRWPMWTVVAVLAVGVAAVGSGVAAPSAFADLGREMGTGSEKVGTRPLYVLGALAAGCLWAAVVIEAIRDRRGRCDECRRTRWGRVARSERVASWGRKATWVAALCSLPYAGLRMTWLTPWPVGISADELADSPGMRLFGLLLGFAAFGGCALTLGLSYRWGEVFPRWVPWLHGRTVPVPVAIVPALAVAAALTVGGHSIIQAAAADTEGWREPIGLVLVFPFPLWGPALAVAAAAYALRRRDPCPACTDRRPDPTLASVVG